MIEIKLNLNELAELKKNMETDYQVEIGLIGEKGSSNHPDTQSTNAHIGAVHEFGLPSSNIPQRSFLRMPLETKMPEALGVLGKELYESMTAGDIKAWFTNVGLEAEVIINAAFETRGFGSWQPLAEETIERKGSDLELIDTGHLARSIQSRVV